MASGQGMDGRRAVNLQGIALNLDPDRFRPRANAVVSASPQLVKVGPALPSHLLDEVWSSVYAGHTTARLERTAAHEALAQELS